METNAIKIPNKWVPEEVIWIGLQYFSMLEAVQANKGSSPIKLVWSNAST